MRGVGVARELRFIQRYFRFAAPFAERSCCEPRPLALVYRDATLQVGEPER